MVVREKGEENKTWGLLPNVQVVCPLSGADFDGKKIAPHYMVASRTKKPWCIYIRCQIHLVKGFINDPNIVARYLNGSNPAPSADRV